MRNPNWTTRRWRRPASLRKERFHEYLARKDLREILGSEFLKGVEARKKHYEDRLFKLLAWQIPIFLFLSLSLVNVETTIGVFGISAKSAVQLRELLLCVSIILGYLSWLNSTPLNYLNEMLDSAAVRAAKNDPILKEFIGMRFGISPLMTVRSYDRNLDHGVLQHIVSIIAVVALLVAAAMFALMVASVQMINLWNVIQHPNFSTAISYVTVAFVVCGDLFFFFIFLLRSLVQPYRTYEDFNKLLSMQARDSKAYDLVIKSMVEEHLKKNVIFRVFRRPQLPRFPQ